MRGAGGGLFFDAVLSPSLAMCFFLGRRACVARVCLGETVAATLSLAEFDRVLIFYLGSLVRGVLPGARRDALSNIIADLGQFVIPAERLPESLAAAGLAGAAALSPALDLALAVAARRGRLDARACLAEIGAVMRVKDSEAGGWLSFGGGSAGEVIATCSSCGDGEDLPEHFMALRSSDGAPFAACLVEVLLHHGLRPAEGDPPR